VIDTVVDAARGTDKSGDGDEDKEGEGEGKESRLVLVSV